jgi:PAS domain S-box-containing protein
MTNKTTSSPTAGSLRRGAEARLRQRPKRAAKAAATELATDTKRLFHELQVHQVELETQNTELEKARDRMEILLEKYTDLYDFAPIGYFSLDEQARVLELNLTGAALLGAERARLKQQRFLRYVAPASHAIFLTFLEQIFAGPGKQLCEAALRKQDGTLFWANIHGTATSFGTGGPTWCRLAVSDITTLKQAEEAQRQMEALTTKTHELTLEIARRRAVEDALRTSEAHQRRLLDQSHQTQKQLRQLSRRVLHAQEEERKRISRELHDVITQTLVGINVSLQAVAREATVNPQGLKRKIARTQSLVAKSVEIVHRFARELRPTSLDDLGLIPSLHSFMKDFTKQTGIRVHFTTFAEVEQLSSAGRTALYRIVHSALTNTAQHAQASRIEVRIEKRGSHSISLEIIDNGISFDVEKVADRKGNKGLGLVGMYERIEMVGGKLTIESRAGEGTSIRAQIPFGRTRSNRVEKERENSEGKLNASKDTKTLLP